jgi:2-oxoisovalerate dehydrogenase E1 component
MMARARKFPGEDQSQYPAFARRFVDDPIAQGRHEFTKPRAVVPQTSTIASHVPKATGLAVLLRHAGKLGKLVVC